MCVCVCVMNICVCEYVYNVCVYNMCVYNMYVYIIYMCVYNMYVCVYKICVCVCVHVYTACLKESRTPQFVTTEGIVSSEASHKERRQYCLRGRVREKESSRENATLPSPPYTPKQRRE